MNDTREQIVAAAKAIMAEGSPTGPSVRAVAARAGIGASTLRHYFPTQRSLYEAVFTTAFDGFLTDLRIADTAVPARERLIECLRQFLPPVRPGQESIDYWMKTFSALFGPDSSTESRIAMSAFVRQARVRVTGWLDILAAEGALRDGAPERRTRFLLAVVDGLSVGRIVPGDHISPAEEQEVIADAVDAVLT